MRDRYRLGGLSDRELLAGLAAVVQRGNEAMAELLAHLAEVDERGLFAELGFSSLFAYCLELHGFSETAAGRRITAARVARKFTELLSYVASGDLHLSAVSALAGHLNQENARELFEACKRKSRRQVDEMLAARFPKPDLRECIRRLPTPAVRESRRESRGESLGLENMVEASAAVQVDSAEIRAGNGLLLKALGSSATPASRPSGSRRPLPPRCSRPTLDNDLRRGVRPSSHCRPIASACVSRSARSFAS